MTVRLPLVSPTNTCSKPEESGLAGDTVMSCRNLFFPKIFPACIIQDDHIIFYWYLATSSRSHFLWVVRFPSWCQILLVKLYIKICTILHPPAGSSPRVKFKPDSVQLLLELRLICWRQVLLHQVFMSDLQTNKTIYNTGVVVMGIHPVAGKQVHVFTALWNISTSTLPVKPYWLSWPPWLF